MSALINPLYKLFNRVENEIHESDVLSMCDKVTEDELKVFNDKLIICQTSNNTVLNTIEVYSHFLPKTNKNNYFGKRAEGEKQFIGQLINNNLENNDVIFAKHIGHTQTFHYLNCSSIFAGVLGELYAQIPSELIVSDKKYYILYSNVSFGGYKADLHKITVYFYEII